MEKKKLKFQCKVVHENLLWPVLLKYTWPIISSYIPLEYFIWYQFVLGYCIFGKFFFDGLEHLFSCLKEVCFSEKAPDFFSTLGAVFIYKWLCWHMYHSYLCLAFCFVLIVCDSWNVWHQRWNMFFVFLITLKNLCKNDWQIAIWWVMMSYGILELRHCWFR